MGNGVEVGHGAGKEETQESCGERLKGQKLHLGSVWLASHMPDGKPIWEGHTCEGDCVLEAQLQAGAPEWESGTQLGPLCGALCSLQSTASPSLTETFLG